MPRDNFLQRKKDVLSRKDKSHIGKWDKKIIKLCNKINSLENYYTTSSCSGRIILIPDKEKKARDLFLERYHDLISFKQLKKDLEKIAVSSSHHPPHPFHKASKIKELIKFKLDPCALHVACRDLDSANKLYSKAKLTGWKKSGIIAINKRYVLELNSTERLELPIIDKGKILVDDNFLRILVKRANQKLRNTWKKIRAFEKCL